MNFFVVDLEATCWPEASMRDSMEIIEIGAVRIDRSTLGIDAEFRSFARPVAQPRLSEFCTRLTSIQQSDVDAADAFPIVLARFVAWMSSEPWAWGSWGAYDLKQFRADASRHALELPASFERHVNLKHEYARLTGTKPKGMSAALRHAGLKLEGTHHRALDDARNIARLSRPAIAAWLRAQGSAST